MTTQFSTTSLTQLKTAVIDFETTGLNVATDRIIDMAAILMDGTKIKPKKFQVLINPQININEKNSEIHNITNETVKDKPTFAEIQQKFHDFIEDRIIIGFNIGFDLALLRNELERYNLPKLNYRHLDIRFLSKILSFPNNQLYLENLAYYFKVPNESRHSAEGDALMTALIYKNLIPILRRSGIQVLAQAEKYIFDQLGFLNYSYAKDWYYPKPPGHSPSKIIHQLMKKDLNNLEKIDPFPFINSVSDIMQHKIHSIFEDETLLAAIKKMNQNKIGCLLIQNRAKEYVSILSERDLLRLLDEDKNCLTFQLKKIPRATLISCSIDDFIFEAQNIMEDNNVRHLPVKKEDKIVGIISNRDFLKRRIKNLNYHQIKKNKLSSSNSLGDALLELPNLARKILEQDIKTHKITGFISREILSIILKVIQITIKKAEQELKSKPPTPFGILVLGSVGRGETLLSFDQDNALIFESKAKGELLEKQRKWFLHFGKIFNQYLDEVGIPFCRGEVMIRNPKWCLTLNEWKNQIDKWFSSTEKNSILNADIFLDAKFVYGESRLFTSLKHYIDKSDSTYFIKLIGENIIEETLYPFTLLGNLRTDKGKIIDIKKNYLFPINSLARLLALKINYHQNHSTRSRLQQAAKALNLNKYEIEVFLAIQEISLTIILKEQLNQLSLGKQAGNFVYLPNLDQFTVESLKQLLPVFKNIEVVVRDFLLSA